VDRWKFYAITHADHIVCNPTSPDALDELIELLDVPMGGTTWEAASGKGELLIRLALRYGIRGVGVDRSPFETAVALERAAARAPEADLQFIQGDAGDHEPPPGQADLAICLGASWIWGGLDGTLGALARVARPGGLVLVGEPFWKRQPELAYLEAAGIPANLCSDLHGNVAIGEAQGLVLQYVMPSRDQDWDRYEALQRRAAERYAAAQPEDPDVPDLLAEVRRSTDAYLRWGRDTLGWAIYLFRVPGPA
jgi:SAM-dependent methyltransferase